MMAGFDLPIRAIREQVASAVQVIIQLSRLRDGSRRVTHITEVSGMEGQTITLQDVFVGQQTGVNEDGRIIYNLVPTGIRPTFMDRLAQYGLTMNIASFARVGAR